MRIAPLLWALALFSCYNPNYDGAHFRCSGDGDCPRDYVCTKNVCQRPGADTAAPDLSTASSDDLSMGHAPEDLRGTAADLSAPGDMVPAGPCQQTGVVVGANGDDVFACRGNFAARGYADLCGVNYHPCGTQRSDSGMIGGIDPDRCATVPGFFAVALDAKLKNGSGDLACGAAGKNDTGILLGCGKAGDENGVRETTNGDCQGLAVYFDCGTTGAQWDCHGGARLADASHQSMVSFGGVLCCKN